MTRINDEIGEVGINNKINNKQNCGTEYRKHLLAKTLSLDNSRAQSCISNGIEKLDEPD